LMRRHAGQALKRPEEVKGAQGRQTGEVAQSERGIGLALDEPHRPCHALLRRRRNIARAG